jgi:hypothetical protein
MAAAPRPPTHDAAMDLASAKFTRAIMRVLRAAVAHYPSSHPKNLGRLRSMGLIDCPSESEVRAANLLFPERSGT